MQLLISGRQFKIAEVSLETMESFVSGRNLTSVAETCPEKVSTGDIFDILSEYILCHTVPRWSFLDKISFLHMHTDTRSPSQNQYPLQVIGKPSESYPTPPHRHSSHPQCPPPPPISSSAASGWPSPMPYRRLHRLAMLSTLLNQQTQNT